MKEFDYVAEDARLRASSLRVTADLDDRPRRSKPRSDSRIRALIALDVAKIRREIEDGTLVIEPGKITLTR